MATTPRTAVWLLVLGLTAALVAPTGLSPAQIHQLPEEGTRLDPDKYPDGHPVKALAKELELLGAPSPLAQPAPGDDELKKLRRERYQSARVQCVKFFDMYVAGSLARGRDPFGLFLKSVNRLAESELALSDRPTDQIAALERKVTLVKGIESISRTRFEMGKTASDYYKGAGYELLGAEMKLLELKRKLAGPRK